MSKAIVFDLDGTLVDSAPDLMDAHNYVMQKFGYHQKPITDIRHLAGRGAANMILSSLKEEDKKLILTDLVNREVILQKSNRSPIGFLQ